MSDIAITGFQVAERVKAKKDAPAKLQKVGRVYHAKAAAEDVAALYIKNGRDAFVQDVWGPAKAPIKKTNRR